LRRKSNQSTKAPSCCKRASCLADAKLTPSFVFLLLEEENAALTQQLLAGLAATPFFASASASDCKLVVDKTTSRTPPSSLLVPHNSVSTATQPPPTLLLRLSHFRIISLYIDNRGFTLSLAEEVAFLHNKIAALPQLPAVVSLNGLIVCKAVFGYVAFLAFWVWETAVGVAKAVGFVGGVAFDQMMIQLGCPKGARQL
jgi:hypothetical protein